MDKQILNPQKRSAPKGSCSVEFISKIVKEEGANIAFFLTRESFIDTAFYPLANKTISYNIVGENEIVEIHYTSSKGTVRFSLNETHDLFTLLSADTVDFKYEYPHTPPTNLYIIANEPSVF